MNKQTLSNFSWLVITLVILSGLIAFGPYIARFIGNEILDAFPQLFLDEENETQIQDDCIEFKSFFPFTLKAPQKGWSKTMQYYDGETWKTWNGSKIDSVKSGYWYYVCIRGTGNSVVTGAEKPWVLDGRDIYCSGNIETLLDFNKVKKGEALTMGNNCYFGLFQNCKNLKSAPNLPSNKLTESCYQAMFRNCSNLEYAPKLPDAELAKASYAYMFSGCANLKAAPRLNAVNLKESCYQAMFEGCTDLVDIQDTLPAQTLETRCYAFMFKDCKSLKKAPELPAETIAEYCYDSMFWGCKKLTDIPDRLPAMDLKEVCYYGMFAECTSLEEVPELPAERMAGSCYQRMFLNCKKLKSTPELPATYLYREKAVNEDGYNGRFCYANMFEGCTRLTEAPELPAMWTAYGSYSGMFKGCISLETAPELPATNVAGLCYQSMFEGCTNLVKAPDKLPGGTNGGWVNDECYKYMFKDCVSLTKAPELLAEYLYTESESPETDGDSYHTDGYRGDYCYESMFENCVSLVELPELIAIELSPGCYKNMFKGCEQIKISESNSGNYTKLYLKPTKTKTDSFSGMFDDVNENSPFEGTLSVGKKYYLSVDLTIIKAPEHYVKFTSTSSFKLKATYPGWKATMQYRNSEAADWVVWNGEEVTSGKNEDGVYFIFVRGIGNRVVSGYTVDSDNKHIGGLGWTLTSTGGAGIECNGNIETLLDYNVVQRGETPAMNAGCFMELFKGCTSLTKAPTLPAAKLTDECYRGMFYGCTGLTKAPTLPAKTLNWACYAEMFQNCTKLETAPNLPATTLHSQCYKSMFQGCTSLKTAPALPATTVFHESYSHMFDGCTRLVDSPDLPATTLAGSCYSNMFKGCTALQTVSTLPATKLEEFCYYAMFQGCTNLKEIPYLPATTLVKSCYDNMFNGAVKISTSSTGSYTTRYTIPVTKSGLSGLSNPVSNMFVNTSGGYIDMPSVFGDKQTVFYLLSTIKVVGN